MTLVLEAAVLGVLTGGVYALMASGLTLIFGVMRIINVGHGALVVLGAYLSFAASRSLGMDPFVTLVITMPVMFVLGLGLQSVFIRPLKTDREALSVLVTYALALGIEGLLGYFFTANYVQLKAWYDTASFPIGDFRVTYVYVFGFLLCLAILGVMFLVLYHTTFGASIRATMLNRTAAQLIGIDVDRVSAVAFGIGMATAAAGGVVFGITTAFNPGSHYDLISRLLTIIVLGGLGSLRGAIVAALIMLVSEDITAVVISPVWATFVFFVILLAVLLVRPQGLYGVRVRHRLEHHGRLHGLHLARPCCFLRIRRLCPGPDARTPPHRRRLHGFSVRADRGRRDCGPRGGDRMVRPANAGGHVCDRDHRLHVHAAAARGKPCRADWRRRRDELPGSALARRFLQPALLLRD